MELPIKPPATPPTAAPTMLCEASPPTSAPEPAPSTVSVDASLLQAAEAEIVPAASAIAAAAEILAKRVMANLLLRGVPLISGSKTHRANGRFPWDQGMIAAAARSDCSAG